MISYTKQDTVALSLFNGGCFEFSRICSDIVAGVVTKCLNARLKTKEASIQVCLMCVEIEQHAVVQVSLSVYICTEHILFSYNCQGKSFLCLMLAKGDTNILETSIGNCMELRDFLLFSWMFILVT